MKTYDKLSLSAQERAFEKVKESNRYFRYVYKHIKENIIKAIPLEKECMKIFFESDKDRMWIHRLNICATNIKDVNKIFETLGIKNDKADINTIYILYNHYNHKMKISVNNEYKNVDNLYENIESCVWNLICDLNDYMIDTVREYYHNDSGKRRVIEFMYKYDIMFYDHGDIYRMRKVPKGE